MMRALGFLNSGFWAYKPSTFNRFGCRAVGFKAHGRDFSREKVEKGDVHPKAPM